MDISFEDTYFLDRDLAYQVALAHNTFKTGDGYVLEQVCYYDGTPFEQAPKNLISVPAENFDEYFQTNFQRIPTRIEPTLSTYSGDPQTIHHKLSIILSAVQKLCRRGHVKKDAA